MRRRVHFVGGSLNGTSQVVKMPDRPVAVTIGAEVYTIGNYRRYNVKAFHAPELRHLQSVP